MPEASLTAGVGLKAEHYDAALACREPGQWFEVHPENYFEGGGARLAWLEAIRARHPISLHGVALSLAGDAPPSASHLRRLKAISERIEPVLMSEHLAWSAWDGQYFPDLLPFPRTAESLQRIAANISRTQDTLGRRIAVENPSHYVRIDGHEWDETDFLGELASRTGCGLLLDVNNVFVSACNMGFDAERYIDGFPARPLMEIHLAGHTADPQWGEALLIDSHDAPICDAVWHLYERLMARTGPRPTLIERDGNLPAFDTLQEERNKAHALLAPHPVQRTEAALLA